MVPNNRNIKAIFVNSSANEVILIKNKKDVIISESVNNIKHNRDIISF